MRRRGPRRAHQSIAPEAQKRTAACGDAKLVPLGKLARKGSALRQSSQDRFAFSSLLQSGCRPTRASSPWADIVSMRKAEF